MAKPELKRVHLSNKKHIIRGHFERTLTSQMSFFKYCSARKIKTMYIMNKLISFIIH